MSNDYLRLSNEDRKTDKKVNEYLVTKTSKKNKRRVISSENSAISLIVDEIYDNQNVDGLVVSDPINKPKLIDTIVFALVYSFILFLFGFICKTSNSLLLLFIFTFLASAFLPICVIYFFYRLDVRGNFKFSTLVYSFIVGIFIYFIIDFFFRKFISSSTHVFYSIVSIRCIIELLTIAVVSIFIIKLNTKGAKSTVFLVGVLVASGFAFSNGINKCLSSMLIEVDILKHGFSIGGIINTNELIAISINKVFGSFFEICVFEPFVFISLVVIMVDIFTSDKLLGKNSAIAFFTSLFCFVTYILTSIHTPFNYLAYVYNIISIILIINLLVKIVNDCIKLENYK